MKLHIGKIDKILVLAPHPDDECIGCGGFLLKYARQCDVILLTDGAKGNREWDEEKTRVVRKQEFINVMQYLGVRKYDMWNIPDLTLKEHKHFMSYINFQKYKYVLVPNRNETHRDHKVIFEEIRRNIRKNAAYTKILEYEVWTPLVEPTHYIDISDIALKKENLIQLYKCPLMHIDYDKRILALNYYRGIQYECKFVECYQLTDCMAERNIKIKRKFFNYIKKLSL